MKTPQEILLQAGSTGQSSSQQRLNDISERQVRLVNALWERMLQLFGDKWLHQEGEALTENGKPSESFLLWCRKTKDLTDEHWRRGFLALEQRIREAARRGDAMWPPSYAAFLGFCDEPDGIRKKALHQFVTPYFQVKALEDKTARERSQSVGSSTLDRLKSMFEENGD